MKRSILLSCFGLLLIEPLACGARTELPPGPVSTNSGGGGQGGDVADGGGGQAPGGFGGAGGMVGGGGQGGVGGQGGSPACLPGDVLVCGIDEGECETGVRNCINGVFGDCEGEVGPVEEQCNNLDDNCDGEIDEGFGLGLSCDGPDTDLCTDDIMTCNGCSAGPNNLEICNGKDDNCNGVTDQDCDSGDCQPNLLVINSTPSSPNCINFPVSAGSKGSIQYPCTGGMVSAVLGSISFSGNVTNGNVQLTGTTQMIGPDNCLWQMDHAIKGNLASGKLNYSYAEILLSPPQNCWSPCTEVGDVDVLW